MKCTDGSRIYIIRGSEIHVLFPKDAKEGAVAYQCPGEWEMKDPYTGLSQFWKPETINIDNVDDPGEITATFADQYGNTFTWTAVSVA